MRFVTVVVFLSAVLASFGVGLGAAERPAAGPLEFGATVEVGFGVVDSDASDTSAPEGVGEASFFLAGSKGQFSAQIEISVAESADTLDGAEHELVWSPTTSLYITISGQNFGIAPDEGNISVVNAPGGPVGDEEAFIDFSGTGMLNVAYTAGATVVGVALLDDCVPECGFGDSSGDHIIR